MKTHNLFYYVASINMVTALLLQGAFSEMSAYVKMSFSHDTYGKSSIYHPYATKVTSTDNQKDKDTVNIATDDADFANWQQDYVKSATLVNFPYNNKNDSGMYYSYYFAVHDIQGNAAALTTTIDAPKNIITTTVFLPVVLNDAGPPAGAPVLNKINNPGGDYTFTVSWSSVLRATSYSLEEDDNSSFSSPTTVYAGLNTSNDVSVGDVGTYYYRVKASNAFGESDWSNVESVAVTEMPLPCPQLGTWTGSGNKFSMDFRVSWTGSTCKVRSVHVKLTATCRMSGGGYWSKYVSGGVQDAPIINSQFESDSTDLTTHVDGDFTSFTAVSGEWSYYWTDYISQTCRGSGTWTGSYNP